MFINNLSEIGAEAPSCWKKQGRLRHEGTRKEPFMYNVNGKYINIYDFRTGEKYTLVEGDSFNYKYIPKDVKKQVQDADIYVHMQYYNSLETAYSTDYMQRKNIGSSLTVKKGKYGEIVIPMYDISFNIKSFQKIYDNKKLFTKGISTKNLFYSDNRIKKGNIFLCEGYATYRTLSKYCHFQGICCFSKNNMHLMDKLLKEQGYSTLVFVDLDIDTDLQGLTVPPVVSDWNDTEKELGQKRTKILIDEILRNI